jgi:hypothetical protein
VDEDLLWLLYARRGPDDDEPRVGCAADDATVRALADDVAARRPDLEVRWESVPFHRGSATPIGVAHLLSVGAPDNLVGLAAFDDREAALRHAARRDGSTVEEVAVGVVDERAFPRLMASADFLEDRAQGVAASLRTHAMRRASR